jgi:hypothetical protein
LTCAFLQALRAFKEASELTTEEEQDVSLASDVEGSLLTARISKATGVLIHHLLNVKDLGELRCKVQAEVRSLRGTSEKGKKKVEEKKVLPKALLAKVADAIAMRRPT